MIREGARADLVALPCGCRTDAVAEISRPIWASNRASSASTPRSYGSFTPTWRTWLAEARPRPSIVRSSARHFDRCERSRPHNPQGEVANSVILLDLPMIRTEGGQDVSRHRTGQTVGRRGGVEVETPRETDLALLWQGHPQSLLDATGPCHPMRPFRRSHQRNHKRVNLDNGGLEAGDHRRRPRGQSGALSACAGPSGGEKRSENWFSRSISPETHQTLRLQHRSAEFKGGRSILHPGLPLRRRATPHPGRLEDGRKA